MMAPEPLRMSAYYYSFDETGVRSVDEILSAVAIAGKAYHHTESWSDPIYNRPESYIDLIQQAAERAAAEIRRLLALTEERHMLECDIDHEHTPERCCSCRGSHGEAT